MTFYAWLAIGAGAACGAWLRWMLGILFNPIFPTMPFGTLAANLAGGYLMGVVMEYFGHHVGIPPELRLGVTTGFLGGLTTFSTFSAEVVTLLSRTEWAWAIGEIVIHVTGSLGMTIAGIFTVRLLTRGAA